MRTIPEGAFVSNPTNVPYMLAGIMWRLETNIVITLWQCILSLWAWGSQKYQGTFAFATPDTWQGLVCSWVLTAWLTGNAHLNTHTHTHIPACTSVWVFMHFNRIFKISILFENILQCRGSYNPLSSQISASLQLHVVEPAGSNLHVSMRITSFLSLSKLPLFSFPSNTSCSADKDHWVYYHREYGLCYQSVKYYWLSVHACTLAMWMCVCEGNNNILKKLSTSFKQPKNSWSDHCSL